MIGEDDYGDEEGEYGEEEYDAPTKAKKKVQEEEYDFMWAVERICFFY